MMIQKSQEVEILHLEIAKDLIYKERLPCWMLDSGIRHNL